MSEECTAQQTMLMYWNEQGVCRKLMSLVLTTMKFRWGMCQALLTWNKQTEKKHKCSKIFGYKWFHLSACRTMYTYRLRSKLHMNWKYLKNGPNETKLKHCRQRRFHIAWYTMLDLNKNLKREKIYTLIASTVFALTRLKYNIIFFTNWLQEMKSTCHKIYI